MWVTMTSEGLVRWASGDLSNGALVDLPHPSLAALLRDAGTGWRTTLERAPVRSSVTSEEIIPAAPLDAVSAYWGIGLNYWSRAAVTGRDPSGEPTLFLRSSATGAVSGREVRLPVDAANVDFEGELAVVIGRPAYRVQPSVGWSHVAFVAPANDMTARDVMRRTGTPALAKSFPGFGPIGSTLVTPDALDDPDDVELVTLVNGSERQRARTSDMVRPVAEIVAAVSRYTVLSPGDVILTGSPCGTGDEEGNYLRSGDRVEVSAAALPAVVTVMGDVEDDA